MAACDILCLPSLREGFGLVLIEAAAVGVPVLASRIYGITDAVTDGETGLLFAPGDAEDLCLKLETLILSDKLRNGLGCKALKDASLIWEHTKLQMELKEFYRRQRSIAAREFGKL
jgi:glycosyltransferase involved in cell wall biosynthesis